MAETTWHLFIDESGDFTEFDPGVVGGLLVPERHALLDVNATKAALMRAVPGAPWPLHAALLNRGAYHALATSQPDTNGRVMGARQVWAASKNAQSAVERVDAAVKAGMEPDVADLKTLDNVLKSNNRPLSEHFHDRARAFRAGLAEVLRASVSHATTPAYVVLGAVDSTTTSMKAAAEPYLAALAALFERAMAVAELTPGTHRIQASLLERDVYEPAIGKARRLHMAHVGAAAAKGGSAHKRARIIPHDISEWGPTVAPLLVAADFLTNSVREAFGNTSADQVVARVKSAIRLDPLVVGTDKPTFSASGAAFAWLMTIPRLGVPATDRPWAQEQALRWAKGDA